MTIDYTKFFNLIRSSPFPGRLSQSQVDNFNVLLAPHYLNGLALNRIAYILATTYWETAHTMMPIREYGLGRAYEYGQPDPSTGRAYYGRGYIQLTWKSNYAKFAELLNVNLIADPDLALQPKIAAEILYKGMIDGLFTGKKLGNYFGEDSCQWEAARAIVNPGDYRSYRPIAEIAIEFYHALEAASG